jgi:hypothetical protein
MEKKHTFYIQYSFGANEATEELTCISELAYLAINCYLPNTPKDFSSLSSLDNI